jgi:hypothetical protein
MGWLSTTTFGVVLLAHPAVPMSAVTARVGATGAVVANCDDFVRVTPSVFTGLSGAWFSANGDREYLSQDTFGPGALKIGGIDPAVWLAGACASR